MMTTDWRLTFLIVSHYITAPDTVGDVSGILMGHFKCRSWVIYLRLMKILECAHLSHTLLWNRGWRRG